MKNQKIADLLFPHIHTSSEEIFAKYPRRTLKDGQIVTRFAPSPTGYVHIGNFFQAFISYNLAKNSNGIYFLRFEDTDKKREKENAKEILINALNYYGITYDEYPSFDGKDIGNYGPYVQSQRGEIYQIFAKKLVAEGKAFPCFCKKTEGKEDVLKQRETKWLENDACEYDPCRELSYEQIKSHIEKGDSFAIRLKTKNKGDERIVFNDLIKGNIEAKANAKDVILLKSDGIPPYPFAHAVDDTLMGTTLVVRGEEYIASTPAHIEIFEALGFPLVQYCHNPLICKIGEEGNRRKISKRYDPEANMMYYIEKGYPKEAILEYLLNMINSGFEIWRKNNPDLPWSEFKFKPNEITAVAPLFDEVKFNDISKNIIAKLSGEELYLNWLSWAEEYNKPLANILKSNKQKFISLCAMDRDGAVKPRKDIYNYSMMEEYFNYIFEKPEVVFDECDKANAKEFLTTYSESYKQASSNEEWFENVKVLAGKLGYATDNKLYKANPDAFKGNVAKACEFIRLAITGQKNSPTLHTIMQILGEEEVKERLKI